MILVEMLMPLTPVMPVRGESMDDFHLEIPRNA